MKSCLSKRSPAEILTIWFLGLTLPFCIFCSIILHFRINKDNYDYGCEDYCESDEEKYAPPDEDVKNRQAVNALNVKNTPPPHAALTVDQE